MAICLGSSASCCWNWLEITGQGCDQNIYMCLCSGCFDAIRDRGMTLAKPCCFPLAIFSDPPSSALRGGLFNKFSNISNWLNLCPSPPGLSVGPEGARLFPGILWTEEGLQAEESWNRSRAEERGMHQIRESTQKGETCTSMQLKHHGRQILQILSADSQERITSYYNDWHPVSNTLTTFKPMIGGWMFAQLPFICLMMDGKILAAQFHANVNLRIKKSFP